jgi:hypothetical protein
MKRLGEHAEHAENIVPGDAANSEWSLREAVRHGRAV